MTDAGRQRLPRLHLRVRIRPARRRAPRDPGARHRGRGAVRERGQPLARDGAHGGARGTAARGHAEEPDPLRHRAQRHGSGRDRRQDDAPRHGAPRDPGLPRLLPRGIDHDRCPWRGGGGDLQRVARAGPGLRARALPPRVPLSLQGSPARRQRRRDGRLHPGSHPLPRAGPRGRRGRDDRARARLGWLRGPAGFVLARAVRALPRARLAALRRRGQERHGADRVTSSQSSAGASNRT